MAEAEAKKRVPTTFAARAAQHQGDIISCEPQFKVNSFRRGSSQEKQLNIYLRIRRYISSKRYVIIIT